MALVFGADSFCEEHVRRLWFRAFARTDTWHNRVFAPQQSIEASQDGWIVRWPGYGEFHARHVSRLTRCGLRGVILASGPSVARLERPERLFRLPVTCVNGSVTLPQRLGHRCDCLLVTDPRFIRDKPDLFRIGTALADAVVLQPATAFAALQFAPDILERSTIYLVEDPLHPFKQRRPSSEALASDPRLIVHPNGRLMFSIDPSIGICPAGTVVYGAIQLLFGLGYEQLFMFGVDLTTGPRFYAEGRPAPSELDDSYARTIEPAFQLVGEYLRRSGRRLVNASLDSRLDAADIPRVCGNDLLERICRDATA